MRLISHAVHSTQFWAIVLHRGYDERVTSYTRPHIEARVFRDDSGAVIDYGNRWVDLDGPPEDSYSVVEHPERFAPLHVVATALVEHFADVYAVDLEEGIHLLAPHAHTPLAEQVRRVVRLTPHHQHAAPITFVWTDDPAVWIYAGALFQSIYPSCSCNACDEDWEYCADEMEGQTFAIVEGGLSEQVSGPKRPKLSFEWGRGFTVGMGQTVSHRLLRSDGVSEESGMSRAEDVDPQQLELAQARLNGVHSANPSGNWTPWTRRSSRYTSPSCTQSIRPAG